MGILWFHYLLLCKGSYVDPYFILKEKRASLSSIIRGAERVYGNEFGARLFLEQIVYFKDIREDPIRFLKKPVSKTEVERFFRTEIGKMQSHKT